MSKFFLQSNKNEQLALMLSCIKGEEIGLHVHSWKPIVEKAGVKYRIHPTIDCKDSNDDACGCRVLLTAYNKMVFI